MRSSSATAMTAEPIRVLFVTSECAPLAKTGGLADVSAALPAALRRMSVDIRTLLPGYRSVLAELSGAEEIALLPATPHFPAARVLQGVGPGGVPLLVADCPPLYDRAGGPYRDAAGEEWPDNPRRFGLLSRIAAELTLEHSPLDWRAQVVHCNDWQSGLAPAYLRFDREARARSVITIHNLAFQGVFEAHWVAQLGLPAESLSVASLEYYGKLSFLEVAIRYADAITTVSPTYAVEIQRKPLGMGLQGLLAERRDALAGILNGIDTSVWNPQCDTMIAQPYDAHSLEDKRANKRALQARLGLAADPEIPLLAMVSRLTYQKGIDLVLEAGEALLDMPAQLAVLGAGERQYEQRLMQLAAGRPGRICVTIGFDEALAHLIEAGADIFLMPSRYEPCGMNQMYSQRYGTVPVVRATGGLVDSVVDCNAATLTAGTASGFAFEEPTAEALLGAVARAVDACHSPNTWKALQTAGMTRDFSWNASARRYLEIYSRLAAG